MNDILRQKNKTLLDGVKSLAIDNSPANAIKYFALQDNSIIPRIDNVSGEISKDSVLNLAVTEKSDLIEEVASDYSGRIQEARDSTIVIVNTNEQRLNINKAIQDNLLVYGALKNGISTEIYRAISISEENGSYTITALQHEPKKEAIVDNGAHFEPHNTTLHSTKPAQVTHSDVAVTEDGITLTWEQPTVIGIVTYDIKLYRNDKLYRTYLDLKEAKLTFEGLPGGSYVMEIRAKNQRGQYSNPVTKAFEINLKIKELRTTSELMVIRLDWQLPTLAAVGSATEI